MYLESEWMSGRWICRAKRGEAWICECALVRKRKSRLEDSNWEDLGIGGKGFFKSGVWGRVEVKRIGLECVSRVVSFLIFFLN